MILVLKQLCVGFWLIKSVRLLLLPAAQEFRYSQCGRHWLIFMESRICKLRKGLAQSFFPPRILASLLDEVDFPPLALLVDL